MTNPRHAPLLLAATLALSAGLAGQTTSLRVAAATVPVRFDGRVDGPAWAVADSITDFRQREPVEGVAASERTVVKVVRDVAALYIAVRA
ncbi:MAG TPA: hypothetical protein VIV10_02900, partial [Gemmatimonadales bacterium]